MADRTDFTGGVYIHLKRINRLARKVIPVDAHFDLKRDLQVCMEHLGAVELVNYSYLYPSDDKLSVTLSPKEGTSYADFNQCSARIKKVLGVRWWE